MRETPPRTSFTYRIFSATVSAATCLTVEVDQWMESSGSATDYGDHEGKPEHTGVSK